MQSALERLDGVSKVVMTFEQGLFEVTAKESSKISWGDIKKAVGQYKLDKVEIAVTGEAARDDKGLWLSARGSGTKYLVVNRPKKDDKDTPEDITGKIDGLLKDGKKLVKLSGELVMKDDKGTVRAWGVEVVEARK